MQLLIEAHLGEPAMSGSQEPRYSNGRLSMKAERFVGHHEAREALVLSVTGVTVIMLIENLILLILY